MGWEGVERGRGGLGDAVLEKGRLLLERYSPLCLFRLFPPLLFLLLSYLVFKLAPFPQLLNLCFKEVLGSSNTDLLDVNLSQLCKLAESAFFNQFTSLGLPEDEHKLTKANPIVAVFVDLLYHRLEAKVGLRSSQLLHHPLDFIHVQETVPSLIVLAEGGLVLLDLLPREFVELGEDGAVGLELVLHLDALVEGVVDGLAADEDVGEFVVGGHRGGWRERDLQVGRGRGLEL